MLILEQYSNFSLEIHTRPLKLFKDELRNSINGTGSVRYMDEKKTGSVEYMDKNGNENVQSVDKNRSGNVRYTNEIRIAQRNSFNTSGEKNDFVKLLGCRKLPDILIIGYEKCGTLTLKYYMTVHPDIFIKKLYGNYELFNGDLPKTVEEYTRDDPCTPPGKLRLEKFATRGLIVKAYDIIPEAKLIAIVKEPVERSMSQYVHRIAEGIEKKPYDFDAMVASIMDYNKPIPLNKSVLFRQSRYSDRLAPWIRLYGINNIHVVDGDNFVNNPAQELQKVEQFLGLRPFISEQHFVYNPVKRFYCLRLQGKERCMAKIKGRPHLVMSNKTRARLQAFYRPFNERFFAMIGRRFPWNY